MTSSPAPRLAHWTLTTAHLRAYQQAGHLFTVVHAALLGDAQTVCGIWMSADWERTQAAPTCRECQGYIERHAGTGTSSGGR